MSGVAIYMEGGGKGKESRSELRRGMNGFLRRFMAAARAKQWHWKLVCCGPRRDALRGFKNAVERGDDTVTVLLVDAEGPVTKPVREHLRDRDKWELGFAEDDAVHLMAQTMETWIVADSEALAGYYGQGFNENALSDRTNLEEEPKANVERTLNQATERSRKGRYHKIRHASDLLRRIDAERVQARCPHCRRLFDVLGTRIALRGGEAPPRSTMPGGLR